MRIGVQIEPQFGFTYDRIQEIAEHALLTGFSALRFSDHFMLNKDATDRVLLDPWLTMAALVRDVDDIRVGTLVACNSYRSPALHAKIAATLDVISEGRLEFGIGAGWKEIEYRAYGYDFPPLESGYNSLPR
ncbi:MAG: LLM class flavin-dependent oxidoreductase [Candidatus Thorarchaeota archaeon]